MKLCGGQNCVGHAELQRRACWTYLWLLEIWSSLGALASWKIEMQKQITNLRHWCDDSTQCYQHIFTQTNTTYILHQNDRKTAFRKLTFHSGTFFPTPSTLKETNAYPCISNEKNFLRFCSSFVVARSQKHTCTYTTNTPVLQHSAVSSIWVVLWWSLMERRCLRNLVIWHEA